MTKNILSLALVVILGGLAARGAFALAEPLGLVQSFAQTASTTAARLAPTTWVRSPMKSCMITNMGTTPVYLGGSDVSSSNGTPICSDTAVCPTTFVNPDVLGGEVWIRTASGTQEVRALCGG